MSRSTPLLLLVFVLTTLPGCKTVVSDHLIGEPVAAEEAQMYEGVWRFADSVMHVKHTEGANLVMAGLEWEDGEFEIQQMDMVVTGLGDARFLQIVMDEDDDEDENENMDDGDDGDDDDDEADDEERPWMVLGIITSNEGHAVVISAPDFDRFAKALEDGVIEGELNDDGNTLHIHGEKAALDALITPDRLHELFELQEPIVITRISDLE